MSIILGFVTEECGLVASDSRITSGAIFKNGVMTAKACPKNDDFDKTFSLLEGKVIGAFAGTTEFNGKIIPEHLQEIIKDKCQNISELNQIIDCLRLEMKIRLESISSSEILFQYRKIDLLLISSETRNPIDLKIYSSTLKPNSNNTEILVVNDIIPIEPKKQGFVYWKTFGDDNSQKVINPFIKTSIDALSTISEKALRSLCYKAIRLGIKHFSKHPLGDELTCGGKPYVKSII